MKKEKVIEIARRLKIGRAKLGLTQQDLADKSGVSRASIAYIECVNCRRNPTYETLRKLEIALELKEKTLTRFI